MAGWRTRLSSLFGRKKPPARAKTKSAPSTGIHDSPRARLIKATLAMHREQGAVLRASLHKSLQSLEDRRTLRDPEALERLLALAQAQRAMQRLFSGDLRRYLVLAGMRQWAGKEPGPVGASPVQGRPSTTGTRR